MRVLHVAAGNLFGGIERMLVTIATADQAREHDVAVCFDGRLAGALRDCGREPHLAGAVRFSRPFSVWRARRVLRSVVRGSGAEAIVAHAPWSCALVAPVARRAGLPLLMWVHDAPVADQYLERRVASRPPDRFICNSQYTAALTAAWMPDVPRCVVYPPVEAARALSAAERLALRMAQGADAETSVIFIAARLEPWKGHRVLLDAAARLQGRVAVWIAAGAQRPHETAALDSLMRVAAEHLPPGRVRFLGERRDVAQLMQAADIYCQPNTAPEPFGIAFVEALAAGVPVVTTAMGGALEIVDERCGILVSESTAPAVAAALQRLIDDPSMRAALGTEGPARASTLSDPATCLRQIDHATREPRLRSSAA